MHVSVIGDLWKDLTIDVIHWRLSRSYFVFITTFDSIVSIVSNCYICKKMHGICIVWFILHSRCELMLAKCMYIFFLQDSPEVHANTAETLCAITRAAPPGLTAKITSPKYFLFFLFHHFLLYLLIFLSGTLFISFLVIFFLVLSCSFIGRLFRHALESSRPKSVLVNSLSICISLLDPKRLTLGTYYTFNRQLTHGSTVTVNPETVEGMLGSLGKLERF